MSAAISSTTNTQPDLAEAVRDVHRAGMPGIIAEVVDHGETTRECAGFAEAATRTPMTPGLHHRVGSIAKTFTTVALLRLVEEGIVDLDTSISRYLPDHVPGERGEAITVRMLANHTSGLNEYLPIIYDSLRAFPNLAQTSPRSLVEHQFTHFDRRDLIDIGVGAPSAGEPGDVPGRYSNTNYLLLAELIETLTDRDAEEFIRAEVIDPAGLHETYFPTGPVLSAPHTSLYESWFSMADPPVDLTDFDMSWVGPAASLVSTAADLNRFFGLLIGGQLLRPESLEQMQRTVPVVSFEGTTIDYGLGLHRRVADDGTVWWGHDGSVWGGGALTFTRADAHKQITILVNGQRWNSLDDSGRPQPHPIDAALAAVIALGMG
ncbi:serine hydrolase domain-containing protein [Brevibacterium atlanticum]|uniref:serine hydrolase domain-containing protein n=1 Tax=Brevibacterium atlanticum TaxID=2697563 RepID=UPI001AA1A48B|nr:serine hydrolase domain-containing protein [Brevibacterium atlanticum]